MADEEPLFEEVTTNELYGDGAFLCGVGVGVATGIGIGFLVLT